MTILRTATTILATIALLSLLTSCSGSGNEASDNGGESSDDGTHTHADGTTHDDHADEEADGGAESGADEEHADHEHDEVPIGTFTIGTLAGVELAQAHGAVEAGKESHLVVKLPYTDGGATTVRAWIGTEDRTLSEVGLGDYAASHDDYDIHTMAPDPLPENAMWWIEIEKPDEDKHIGSAPILTE